MTASRESYAAAAEKLDALALDAGALVTAADDVLALAGLLAREPRLRRALSDPARTGEDRVGLLRDVLGGGPGTAAKDLMAALVVGRWSAPGELRDATERLGVDALLAAADRDGKLGDVEDELFRFGQIVDGTPELVAVIGDSTVDPSRRAALAESLLDGKANPVTTRLAIQAVRGFGGRSLAAALTRLVELVAERRDRSVAYVTVAAPLTEAEEQRLGDKLSELYGRGVSLKTTVDPAILGGMRVQIGDDLYDGTVARRLTETRNALTGRS